MNENDLLYEFGQFNDLPFISDNLTLNQTYVLSSQFPDFYRPRNTKLTKKELIQKIQGQNENTQLTEQKFALPVSYFEDSKILFEQYAQEKGTPILLQASLQQNNENKRKKGTRSSKLSKKEKNSSTENSSRKKTQNNENISQEKVEEPQDTPTPKIEEPLPLPPPSSNPISPKSQHFISFGSIIFEKTIGKIDSKLKKIPDEILYKYFIIVLIVIHVFVIIYYIIMCQKSGRFFKNYRF